MPYRLDMRLDAFDLEIDGHTFVVGQQELDRVRAGIDGVYACWPEPKPAQLWTAVIDALGRDPRR